MEKTFDAIILNKKPLSSSSFLITVLTEDFGIISGATRASSKKQLDIQNGNIVKVEQKKRLDHQLGTFNIQLTTSPYAKNFENASVLFAINYFCELFYKNLQELDPHPNLYTSFLDFLNFSSYNKNDIIDKILILEVLSLSEFGYGLTLGKNFAVKENNLDTSPIIYLSPNSGRVVSQNKGLPYKDKLLKLPNILGGEGEKQKYFQEILDLFAITWHFLYKEGAIPKNRELLINNILEEVKKNDELDNKKLKEA